MGDIRGFHNSHDLYYRNPFGAVESGKSIELLLSLNIDARVYLHISTFEDEDYDVLMNKIDNNDGGDLIYKVEFDTRNRLGVVNYYFKIIYNYGEIYYGNNNESLGGIGMLYNYEPKAYQITIYNKHVVPSWYKEGIIYQIFVDRFYNGNDDGKINNPKKNSFIYGRWEDNPMYIKDSYGNVVRWDFYGGNLKGVLKKLRYIKDLGASIIYFNPIFESSSSHKYDTGDYEKIDSMFGTEEDFKELCIEAKKLGIKIILDGVFSHTGSDSKYFNKYGNYDEIGAYQSVNSKYYKWYKFFEYPYSYETWWGVDNMPNVNELNSDYVEYIIKNDNSIIAKWLKLGASGWRLDVADELPDEFIKMIKEKMISIDSKSVLIGEVWEDASNKISYSKQRKYLLGEELDSTTNYPLRDTIIWFLKGNISAELFARKILNLYENYPIESFYSCMNIVGNHDTERIFSILNEDIELLKLALSIQMTMPGVPVIYYGDEAGLTGWKDPDNRKSYPWNNVNEEIFNLYKKFTHIRNESEALRKGILKSIRNIDEVLLYEREFNKEKIIILINPISRGANIKISNVNNNIKNLLDNNDECTCDNGIANINLKGYECKLIKIVYD